MDARTCVQATAHWHSCALHGTHLDLLRDKQALHDLPVVLCQSGVVQANPKLQAVPQRGVPHTCQGVLQSCKGGSDTVAPLCSALNMCTQQSTNQREK